MNTSLVRARLAKCGKHNANLGTSKAIGPDRMYKTFPSLAFKKMEETYKKRHGIGWYEKLQKGETNGK